MKKRIAYIGLSTLNGYNYQNHASKSTPFYIKTFINFLNLIEKSLWIFSKIGMGEIKNSDRDWVLITIF